MRRRWLWPLVPLYWAGLVVKGALVRPRRLRWPVVSVGSLSAGGAGKTPVVKMLARLLAERGFAVDVLSRGYRRAGVGVERVVLAGDGGDARRFGDEPVEMARAGLEVWVGAERYAAGLEAEREGDAGIHLLDDGFQHRRLARDLDVVLLTREDVLDWLLPAGNLREPLGALRRADVVVVREEEARELRSLAGRYGAAVWMVRRRLVRPEMMPGRVLAFCGLARPEGFVAMLLEAGYDVAGTVAFADHHAYGGADIARLVAAARVAEADGYVTTAKDAVKLSDGLLADLAAVGPVVVAELQVSMVGEEAAMEQIVGWLREKMSG